MMQRPLSKAARRAHGARPKLASSTVGFADQYKPFHSDGVTIVSETFDRSYRGFQIDLLKVARCDVSKVIDARNLSR